MWNIFKSKETEADYTEEIRFAEIRKREYNQRKQKEAQEVNRANIKVLGVQNELFSLFAELKHKLKVCDIFLQDNYCVHTLNKVPRSIREEIEKILSEAAKTYQDLIMAGWEDDSSVSGEPYLPLVVALREYNQREQKEAHRMASAKDHEVYKQLEELK